MKMIQANKSIIIYLFVSFVIFNFLFLNLPSQAIWDEAYYLGESLLNKRHLIDGNFSNLLANEHKATIYPLFGSVAGLLFEKEIIGHYLVSSFFFLVLVFFLVRVLRIYYDQKISIIFSIFILTFSDLLNIYPLFMRDIPFAAVCMACIFYFCENKKSNSKVQVGVTISSLLALLIRPVFAIVYFLVPILLSLYSQIRFRKIILFIFGLLITSFLLKSNHSFLIMNSPLFFDLGRILEKHSEIQSGLFILVFISIMVLFFRGESRKFLFALLLPLTLTWSYIYFKLQLLYQFIFAAIFSDLGRRVGAFDNSIASIFSKFLKYTMAYDFPVFVFLFIVAVSLSWRKKKSIDLSILTWILFTFSFFFIIQPAHDSRQISVFFIVSYCFLLIKSRDYLVSFKNTQKVFLGLIGINIIMFALNYGTVFRTDTRGDDFSKIYSRITNKTDSSMAYVNNYALTKDFTDLYRNRYWAVKFNRDWRVLPGFNGLNITDSKEQKLNLTNFKNYDGVKRYYLIGPIDGDKIEIINLKVQKDISKAESNRRLLVLSLILKELSEGIHLQKIDEFEIKGTGKFIFFKSNVY